MRSTEFPTSLEVIENAARRVLDQAIEHALDDGPDMPVRAMAMRGSVNLAEASTNEMETGNPKGHAELLALDIAIAIARSKKDSRFLPDILVTTMEPFGLCLKLIPSKLAKGGLIAFIVQREELSDRGIVNSRDSIFERTDLGLNVLRLSRPDLQQDGLTLFDHVMRDIETGVTTIDTTGLQEAFPGIRPASP